MSEEEFEERQLTKLISDLRDINSYTDFKNGAFIYDLGHYQGLLLVNEIERLNNIINELKEWFKGYHKSSASCKWYEEDYIEFIEHLENILKGVDKE